MELKYYSEIFFCLSQKLFFNFFQKYHIWIPRHKVLLVLWICSKWDCTIRGFILKETFIFKNLLVHTIKIWNVRNQIISRVSLIEKSHKYQNMDTHKEDGQNLTYTMNLQPRNFRGSVENFVKRFKLNCSIRFKKKQIYFSIERVSDNNWSMTIIILSQRWTKRRF